MIDQKHYEALVLNNKEILKKNTQLNAMIVHLEVEQRDFKKAVNEKLEATIKMYDGCNDKVIDYLIRNSIDGNIICKVKMLFPIKIGGE